MKFDRPATTNPIDRLKVVGKPADRIDGPLKTTGTARYAYERDDAVKRPAYGCIVGATIATGRVESMELSAASAAPGVLAIVTALNAGALGKGDMKAKGVGELGLCGVAAALANAIHNATGIRVRDYPITLDKLLDLLPEVA